MDKLDFTKSLKENTELTDIQKKVLSSIPGLKFGMEKLGKGADATADQFKKLGKGRMSVMATAGV